MLYEQVAAALDLVILMNSHLSMFKFRDHELHQSLIGQNGVEFLSGI